MAGIKEHSNSVFLDALADSFLLAWVLSHAGAYYTWFGNDTKAKKYTVGILVALSIVQSCIEDFKLWFVLVQGHEWQRGSLLWSDLCVSGVTNSIVEFWFILRCWKMAERRHWLLFLLCALWLLVVCANVVNIVQVSLSFTEVPTGTTPKPSSATNILFAFWTTGSLVLDSVVAVILIFKLYRSKTGLPQSDHTVQRIIRLTWETASLPAISFLLAVILFQAGHELSMFFVLITSKLHVIGFLRSLNARRLLRRKLQSQNLGRVSLQESLPWIDQDDNAPTTLSSTVPSSNIPSTHITLCGDEAAVTRASGSLDRLAESDQMSFKRVVRDTEKEA